MIDRIHGLIAPLTARLSLALRVAILTTLAVAATLAAVSAMVFITVRAELEGSLDHSMLHRAKTAVEAGVTEATLNGYPPSALNLADVKVAVVRSGMFVDPTVPYIRDQEVSVSLGDLDHSLRTAKIDGTPYRIVAVQSGRGTALVLAQSMESSYRILDQLKLILWFTSIAGIAVAGLSGWVVATNGLRPVRRLTDATERVARTQQLDPIKVMGRDELARLTTSFNSMLVALDASQQRQRQLVADAGHELRTPLTSLRTNIELLTQASRNPDRSLPEAHRAEIMSDVQAQLQELSTLVGDLVELARDEPMRRDPEPVDLADVVRHAVERVRLRAPGVAFDMDVKPWMVFGEPLLLERAVTNLLDNSAKWSPPGGTVQIRLRDGVLTVADEGPGIADADLPHIFDRFYRSSEARTLPGSGLGLSIVRRATDRHGGSVEARSPKSGGTLFTMRIPGVEDSSDARIL
ncbi:MAG: sensor histidine kinase [Aeromicrobium sp.]